MMRQMLELLLPDDGVELSHADVFGSFHCLSDLMLMLLRQQWNDLSAYSTEPLYDLRLLLHLDVQPVRHFIIHDIMSVHLCFLTRQLLAFQLQTVILSLEQLEFLFYVIQSLQNGEFHAGVT